VNAQAWFGLLMIVAVLGYGLNLVREERRQRKHVGQPSNLIDQLTLLVCALVMGSIQLLVFLWLEEKNPDLSRVVFYAVSFFIAFVLFWAGNRFANGVRRRANKRHHGS
jgi:hypothetical protein